MKKGAGKCNENKNEQDTKDKDGTCLLLEFRKYNNNKNMDVKNSQTIVQQPKGKDNLNLNGMNNDNNYSLSSENEEEQFNSDEYISSTMLDVETNTYIEPIEKNSNNYILNINDKDINKSQTKTNEEKNVKSYFKKYINNDIDYINTNGNGRINSNDKEKKNKIKNDNNNYSSSKKINKNDKSKDILFKKLKIKNIINSNDRDEEKSQKLKLKKKLKNVEKENKNYSMMGCKSPLNIIYSKDNSLKLDNINSNFLSLIKSHNSSKQGYKKIKTDINNIKININEKNKSIKHNRTPTMINNKNINIKDLIIKQQYKKICDNKIKRKILFSPTCNKKLCINSMKIINSLNTLNNKETLSSSLNNNINNESQNQLIYLTNNNNYLVKSNNTININNNSNINKTINFNILSNNNKNNINHALFSPLKNKLDINLNRNTSPVYNHNPFNSNSISIENNHNISNNKFDSNRISNKLLAYSFQDQKLLSRNKTFKNKRLHNNNKFFNLLLNKKKMNIINSKNMNEQKKSSKSKSPKIILNLNDLKKMTDNIIKRNNQIKIGARKMKNNNGSINVSKNSYLNSYSNRKQNEQNFINKNNIYKRDKKFHSKQFIYIKKENLSNIVKLPIKNVHEANPFNQDSKNTSNMNSKNLSLSKSNKRYINTGNSEVKDKSLNINLTSINLIKNAIKNKKINLEIGRKKKNKYRAKTLMEQDYLRDVLINNKDMNLKDYCNNKSAYNMSLNSNNYNNLNNRQERSTNYSPSIKEIMKNPTQKHDINFNININMNNNNYKKLIYHYHGHNNSSINNSYVNKNERNSNLSFNPIMKKRDISGKDKEFYKKRNSNDIYNNELKMNKNHEIKNKDNSNYNSCFLNGSEFNNINCLNSLNNIYTDIVPNCNNYIEEYYENSSSIVNKNKNNVHNSNISKNFKKQHLKNENKKNNYSKINIKDNHKKENNKNKNKIKNNIKKKKEYLPLDINNTLSNSDFEQNKSAYNSNFNIQLSNNDSIVNNCFKLNSPKNYIDINKKNNQKVKMENNIKENGSKTINEMNEFYNDNYEDNLDKLDNYICNYYYSTNSNKNDN